MKGKEEMMKCGDDSEDAVHGSFASGYRTFAEGEVV